MPPFFVIFNRLSWLHAFCLSVVHISHPRLDTKGCFRRRPNLSYATSRAFASSRRSQTLETNYNLSRPQDSRFPHTFFDTGRDAIHVHVYTRVTRTCMNRWSAILFWRRCTLTLFPYTCQLIIVIPALSSFVFLLFCSNVTSEWSRDGFRGRTRSSCTVVCALFEDMLSMVMNRLTGESVILAETGRASASAAYLVGVLVSMVGGVFVLFALMAVCYR